MGRKGMKRLKMAMGSVLPKVGMDLGLAPRRFGSRFGRPTMGVAKKASSLRRHSTINRHAENKRRNPLVSKTGRRPAGAARPSGQPVWAKKDDGAWSIPKGLVGEGEDWLAAAKREFFEETGRAIDGEFLDLGAHKQPGGKTIVAFAHEGDFDAESLKSNTFSIEWPPHSGRTAEFPEVDKAAWVSLDQAIDKAAQGQGPIIAALAEKLGA